MIGAMKANDDPRKMGTLPFVVNGNESSDTCREKSGGRGRAQRATERGQLRQKATKKELYAYYCSSEW